MNWKRISSTGEINLTNGLGTSNSHMLEHLFNLQPEAVSLFHFFREFLKDQGFTHFKGYTLVLLIVYYLQMKGFLPTIETVQRDVKPKLIDGEHLIKHVCSIVHSTHCVTGWSVQLKTSQTLADYGVKQKLLYQEHIGEIFKFYKEHDFSKVISVYDGKILDADEYKERYPDFDLKGIRIVGPINRKRNCGIVEDSVRDNFIQLIKQSADHLEKNLI